MKSLARSALAWSIAVAFPLAVACGANDNAGLFSQSTGGQMASVGGSLGTSNGGSTARGGSSSAGTASANGGASATGSVAGTGQGTSGSGTGSSGGSGGGVAGSGSAGMSMGGASGSASGGSAGTGNAGTGNAGTGNAGTGNAGTGNNAGAGGSSSGAGGMSAGGSAGASGAGGSGGAGSCPDTAPGNGVVCGASTPDGCYYPGVACTCLAQNNGGGGPSTAKGKWACLGSREPMCPQDLPMTGDSCVGKSGSACPYSSADLCICNGDIMSKWECSAGNNFTCPTDAPTPGAMCDTVAICQYPGGACGCNGAKWVCQGG